MDERYDITEVASTALRQRDALQLENTMLRDVLGVYADPASWEPMHFGCGGEARICWRRGDNGTYLAQQALDRLKG